MRVAVCGLGRMGTAFTHQLIAAGHEVIGWNRTPRPVDNVSVAGSLPEAVASAEVIVVSVFDGPAAREVLLGPDGIVPTASRDALVVNTTTLSPAESRELADAVAGAGFRYVEAPVVGSVPVARKAALAVLAGGKQADVDAARSVIDSWSRAGSFRYTGPAGTASALKLIANLILGTALAGIHDAVRLGADFGVDRTEVLDLLRGTPVGPLVSGKFDRLRNDDYADADFTVAGLAKDLALASESSPASLPAAEAAASLANAAINAGEGDHDISVFGRTPR